MTVTLDRYLSDNIGEYNDLHSSIVLENKNVYISSSTELLTCFTIDSITYQFDKPLTLELQRYSKNYDCKCHDFYIPIIGKGENQFDAREDWQQQFHTLYQSIRGLMDYELDKNQLRLRDSFRQYISDVEYHEQNPIHRFEIGKIVELNTQDNTIVIEWVNLCQEQLSGSLFAKYQKKLSIGVWFEVKICRNFYNGQVLSIDSLNIIEDFDKDIDD